MTRSVRWLPWLLLLPWIAGCGDDSARADDAPEPIAVETTRVELAAGYEVRELFAGRVVARRASELGFERSGRVVEVLVDDGDVVEAGQVLARLESRQLRARQRELAARAREIDSRLALARVTTARRERLRARESISEQAFDEARFEEQALEAQLAAARAGLERVRVDLELSELAAPYAGIVTGRGVDEGTVVAPGQELLRLIEGDALELRVGVPEETAARLDPEQAYEVEVAGAMHPVVLDAVLPTVEPDTRTVTAVFRFLEPPEDPLHGALGKLAVTTWRAEPGFWLPITALAESRRGLWAAYALVPPDEGEGAIVERRELQLLQPESERAFLRGTLADGETVVRSGVHRIVPGQRVRALPAEG